MSKAPLYYTFVVLLVVVAVFNYLYTTEIDFSGIREEKLSALTVPKLSPKSKLAPRLASAVDALLSLNANQPAARSRVLPIKARVLATRQPQCSSQPDDTTTATAREDEQPPDFKGECTQREGQVFDNYAKQGWSPTYTRQPLTANDDECAIMCNVDVACKGWVHYNGTRHHRDDCYILEWWNPTLTRDQYSRYGIKCRQKMVSMHQHGACACLQRKNSSIVADVDTTNAHIRRVVLGFPNAGGARLMHLLWASLFFDACPRCELTLPHTNMSSSRHLKVSTSMSSVDWKDVNHMNTTLWTHLEQQTWNRLPLFTHGVQSDWLDTKLSLKDWQQRHRLMFATSKDNLNYRVLIPMRNTTNALRSLSPWAFTHIRNRSERVGVAANITDVEKNMYAHNFDGWKESVHSECLSTTASLSKQDVLYDHLVDCTTCVDEMTSVIAFFDLDVSRHALQRGCYETNQHSLNPLLTPLLLSPVVDVDVDVDVDVNVDEGTSDKQCVFEPSTEIVSPVFVAYPKTGTTLFTVLTWVALFYDACPYCRLSYPANADTHFKHSTKHEFVDWHNSETINKTNFTPVEKIVWSRAPLFLHGVIQGWIARNRVAADWENFVDQVFRNESVQYRSVTLHRDRLASFASGKKYFGHARSERYNHSFDRFFEAFEKKAKNETANKQANVHMKWIEYADLGNCTTCPSTLRDVFRHYKQNVSIQAINNACFDANILSLHPVIAQKMGGIVKPKKTLLPTCSES